MSTYDDTSAGQPHGRSNPIRWDVSTATAVLALGALAYLVIAKRAFKVSGAGSVSASAGVR